jgi:hypothetical protein
LTHEAQACMVAVVWLIVEASGPVQLHRSPITTVDLVAAAGAACPATPSSVPTTVAKVTRKLMVIRRDRTTAPQATSECRNYTKLRGKGQEVSILDLDEATRRLPGMA